VGLETAWTLRGADKLVGITNAAGWQIPVPGAHGGYPGGATEQRRIRPACSEIYPPTVDPTQGETIEAKANNVELCQGDIWYMRYPGGGGWGDPLDRDPALVSNDVRIGAVSQGVASSTYGVVLCESAPGFEAEATRRKREALRTERLLVARSSDGSLTRRERLAEGLARHGAYVVPRNEVKLVETFEAITGRTREVGYTAHAGAPLSLPPADHRVL
jgi:N-methylhydantoinase B